MKDLSGLATGIGSFPYQEPEAALDLIFKYIPHIPFWPQLPKRDIREGMIAQFSEGLPCVKIKRDGAFFDGRDKEKELELFYSRIIGNEVEHFKISMDFARGLYAFNSRLDKINLEQIRYIKCHITGPFSFAASLKDEKGVSLLHDSVFMQAIIKGLSMKALWQVKFFEKFAKDIIVFIDEPYLGCFGSGYTPINREDVVKGLSDLTKAIKSAGALIGLHCCGNTDWSIFTQVQAIDIISFDAFAFQDKFVLYTDDLKSFLGRGGIICWGIVPTQEFSGKETTSALIAKLKQGIDSLVNKGIDKELLYANMLISPACGLGALDSAKAEVIFKALQETSFLVGRKEGL